jgi:hypothetical protein
MSSSYNYGFGKARSIRGLLREDLMAPMAARLPSRPRIGWAFDPPVAIVSYMAG